MDEKTIQRDLVVIGAGMPGIMASLQAARLGMSVALVHNRGYLGGNASAEIRCPIDGADGASEVNFYAREGGILEEIRLENLYKNPQRNPYIWDSLLKDFIYSQNGIDLFLNVNADQVRTSGNRIISVAGSQLNTETRFGFRGELFVDNTGDGTVGHLAGAQYRMGRESKEEFGEKLAPEQADDYVLPSTLTFYARDVGEPVHYKAPDFALDVRKIDSLKHLSIPHGKFFRFHSFYGIGGDQIKDFASIAYQHEALV